MDDESIVLLGRYRSGDAAAASAIFERYVSRLIGLARTRMSERLSQRVDPEDVVQSVYRSFFCKARDGRYELEKSGDLWKLLASITVNKVLKQAERHRQQKRSLAAERPLSGGEEFPAQLEFMARDPEPFEALALVEELEYVTRNLEPHERAILELKLQGQENEVIAKELDRSERTVRRTLEKIKAALEGRLAGTADSP
jgi:RNA polymerase sigma factor (sigma-70 family)